METLIKSGTPAPATSRSMSDAAKKYYQSSEKNNELE
jgi:hypothetical protein